MKLFKVKLMVTKVNRLKSQNKYLHLVTHPCIPSKEGNNGIYFHLVTHPCIPSKEGSSVIDLLLYGLL